METTLFDQLPDDVAVLILLRLPPKLLVRLKVVSKSWKRLISSHSFGYGWYNSSVLPRGNSYAFSSSFLLLRRRCKPEKDNYFTRFSVSHMDVKLHELESFRLPNISFVTEFEKFALPHIFPAGFGIYCLFERHSRKVSMWNPTIRELKLIPFSPFNSDDEKDIYCYGFGHVVYNEGVFSYKVGIMRRRQDTPYIRTTIELYSSREDSWKLLEDCCITKLSGTVYNKNGWPYSGTNLNGKFHWFNWFSKKDPHIVTFDMKTEKFGRLEVPAFLQHSSDCDFASFSFLTKIGDNYLCLLLFRGTDGEAYLDVWIMMEYGITESWTKKATSGPITDPEYVDVLGICDSIKGLFFQSREPGDGLFFCRYGSEKSETLLPIKSQEREMMSIVEHKTSIVSLNGTSDERAEPLS